MAEHDRTVRRAKILTAAVLVLLVLLGGRTILGRISNGKVLEAGTGERARGYVRTAQATGGAAGTLALPGSLQGFVQAPIAARASGYVKRWPRDVGSRVEKGELLAEIETPEID